MCGIAGIVQSNILGNKENLKMMMNAIQHRGPDSSNSFLFDNCALGHLRLSIIDLNSGDQPMFSNTRQSAIVFNGEIYDFQKIKNELKNYSFKTTSDTEVILALYEEYGENFVNKLPGMFSFAIWNNSKQELICARDRFGEKPFYYAIGDKGEFLFASEIKALVASGLITPVLNMEAIVHYMKHLYVHPYQTIYSNINVLPPAHQLKLSKGEVSVKKYWSLPKTDFKISIEDAEEEFKKLFSKAVEKQLVADVPVGAFLSGGLDSSTVVAVASQFKKNIQTFSFGFEHGANELPFAKMVADKYQTNHTELEDKKEDIGELLLIMQSIYDEPFADSSNIPTYLISKYASKHLKVVLTGDGGDELLAGYNWYKSLLEIPEFRNKTFARVLFLKLIEKYIGNINHKIERHYKDEIADVNAIKEKKYAVVKHGSQNTYFSNEELIELGLIPSLKQLINLSVYDSNTLDDALRMDIENYMPGDILVKTDRASMANGLELRAPFLDVDFASFCISLPYSLKINKNSDKLILKKVYNDFLPEQIKTRAKQGFGAPVDQWLKIESVNVLKYKYLTDPNQKIFSIVSFKKVQKMIVHNNYKTWILLVLALWMDIYSFKVKKIAEE